MGAPVGVWLKQQIATRRRQVRLLARLWLRRHPRMRALLARSGSLDPDERALARGVAVGLFVGLTPTVGVQTPLMVAASVLFRANFPAAFIVSWINNPLTLGLLYFSFHEVGDEALALLPIRFDGLSGSLFGLGEALAEDVAAIVIGSLLIALPMAFFGYFTFLHLWRRLQVHRSRPGNESGDVEPRL
ncbi:MAG: DUF2062 domain-containing protein [Pseudomonadales bacterium]